MWIYDPAAHELEAIPAVLPQLTVGEKRAMTTIIPNPLHTMHNALKSLSPEARQVLEDEYERDDSPPQSQWSLLSWTAKLLKYNPLENVMAAQTLLPDQWRDNPAKAVLYVSSKHIQITSSVTVYVWNVDTSQNTETLGAAIPKEEYDLLLGADYNKQYIPGKTLIVARNSKGQLINLPEESLPKIVFRPASSENYARREKYVALKLDAKKNGELEFIKETSMPLPLCAHCKEACAGESVSCRCRKYTYCSTACRDVVPHCVTCNAKDCDNPASKKCGRCLEARYCCDKCQSEDWKVHKTTCVDLRPIQGENGQCRD
jgi:hypothetical protein